MIISVSRRTDVPAFYSRWFMNRLAAGFADVANPFNPRKIRHVDLMPEAVDAIIFWTRNPRPLFKYLDQIDSMGFHYYFFYTITGYPKVFEPNLPPLHAALDTLKELSQKIGPKRVIWRYDPIVYSSTTDGNFHKANFETIARELSGSTEKVIISFVDPYKKTLRRIEKMAAENGIEWRHKDSVQKEMIAIAENIKAIADSYKIKIQSCAEDFDLSGINIPMGSCIDHEHLNSLFGLDLKYKKDPHQRPKCMCHSSVDIGAYNTCGYRCIYCYANSSFDSAAANLRKFDIGSASLYNRPGETIIE